MTTNKLRLALFPLSSLLLELVNASAADESCLVPADPDILGLGVRLGLYFQMRSILLMALVRPKEAADAFLPTAFFFASFLFAVLYSIIRNEFPPSAMINCTWYLIFVLGALIHPDFSGYSTSQVIAR